MSVPHSTILSCSRGVLAKTDVGYCSPKQSQNSSSYAENNVKVVVYPKKEDARINAPTENGLKDDSCSFLRLQVTKWRIHTQQLMIQQRIQMKLKKDRWCKAPRPKGLTQQRTL